METIGDKCFNSMAYYLLEFKLNEYRHPWKNLCNKPVNAVLQTNLMKPYSDFLLQLTVVITHNLYLTTTSIEYNSFVHTNFILEKFSKGTKIVSIYYL